MDTMMRLNSSCKLKPSFSSQEVVLDNEDLLTLILLRVPWETLMSLKCVSKQWRSFMTTPHFRNLLPPLRAIALFITRRVPGDLDKLFFVPLDNPKTPSPFAALTFPDHSFDPQRIRVLHSCNGLLLCSTSPSSDYYPRNCYVCDPSTKKLVMLPHHHCDSRGYYMGIAYDPLKSLHYKVIAFVFKYPRSPFGDICIYYSETRTWRDSLQSFIRVRYLNVIDCVYWKGRVHWLGELYTDMIDVPKSADSDCLCFNVDEERLETFPRPPIAVRWDSKWSLYFGVSEDHLHAIEAFPVTTSLKVYELKIDYSGWFVKYCIDLAPIFKVFPEMTQHTPPCYDGKRHFAVTVLSVIRRESFGEDSFLVLDIPGKAIRYNLVDISFKVIWDFSLDDWKFRRSGALQYIALL